MTHNNRLEYSICILVIGFLKPRIFLRIVPFEMVLIIKKILHITHTHISKICITVSNNFGIRKWNSGIFKQIFINNIETEIFYLVRLKPLKSVVVCIQYYEYQIDNISNTNTSTLIIILDVSRD